MTSKDSLETTAAKLRQPTNGSSRASELLRQYGCGPIPFVGTENAFYERHLIFDRAIAPEVATERERFEAFSRHLVGQWREKGAKGSNAGYLSRIVLSTVEAILKECKKEWQS